MNYKVVPEIKAVGWPVTGEDYKESHRASEEHERKVFGTKKFCSLQKAIESKLPRGELAGSHTKEGEILVSAKIPEKYHSQIVEHEKFEHRRMTRQRRQRTVRRR